MNIYSLEITTQMDQVIKNATKIRDLIVEYSESYEQSMGPTLTFNDKLAVLDKTLKRKVNPDALVGLFETVSKTQEILVGLEELFDLFDRDPEVHNTSMSQTFIEESLLLKQKVMEGLSFYRSKIPEWEQDLIDGQTFPNSSWVDIKKAFLDNPLAISLFQNIMTPRMKSEEAQQFLRDIKFEIFGESKEDSSVPVQNSGLSVSSEPESFSEVIMRLYKTKIGKALEATMKSATKRIGLIVLSRPMSDLYYSNNDILGLKEPTGGPDSTLVAQTNTIRTLSPSKIKPATVKVYNDKADKFYVICEVSEGYYRQLGGEEPRQIVSRLLKKTNSSYVENVNNAISDKIFDRQSTYLMVADEFKSIPTRVIASQLKNKSADLFLPSLVNLYKEVEPNPTSEEMFTFIHATHKQFIAFQNAKKKKAPESEIVKTIPNFEDIQYKKRLVVG